MMKARFSRPFWALAAIAFALLLSLGCGGAKKRGTLCQDDSGCTGAQICLGGTCVAATVCTNQSECAGGVCYDGHCYSEQCGADNLCPEYLQCIDGYCVRKAATTGGDTSEPQPDAKNDTSSENQCVTNADCIGKVANLGECEEAVCQSGNCVKGYKAADAPCSDGNACTSGDKCDGKGLCQPGSNTCECQTDNDCTKLNDSCNNGYCDLTTNKCAKNPIKEAQPCDDGNACTKGETCQSGVCTGGTNPCVDALDACKKTAVCTPGSGTDYTCDYSAQDKASCDDKSSCTTTDTCDKGVCVGSGNPCVVDADPCRKNALCNKVTDTTHTCDFSPDNGVDCDDKLECTTPDKCDGTTGTCRGTNRPLLTGCTLPDQSAGVCGFFGDCTSVATASIKVPQDTYQYQFQALCDPGTGKALYPVASFTTDSQQSYYGTANVAMHKLVDGKLELRPKSDAYDRQYTSAQRFTCLGDKLAYARIEQFPPPNWYTDVSLGLLYYDSVGDQWLRETSETKTTYIDDKFKNFLTGDSVYLSDVFTGGRLKDSYYFTLTGDDDSVERLVTCTDTYTDPGDISCTTTPLANLPSSQGFLTTTMLTLPTQTSDPDIMFTSSINAGAPGQWIFTSYRAGKFQTTCDGRTDAGSPCAHFAGTGPTDNVMSSLDFTAFRAITAASFDNIYVVGAPRFPIWNVANSQMLSFNPDCTSANEALVCASGKCDTNSDQCTDGPTDRVGVILHFDGVKWAKITVPDTALLRYAGTDKVAFHDFVFDNAIYLASEKTLLVAAHYRTCTDPNDAANCKKAGADIKISSQPFLFAYYEATKTFSKPVPIGDPRTLVCCHGGYQVCPYPRLQCSYQEAYSALGGHGIALGLLRDSTTAQLYLLENRWVAPKSCTDSSECTGTNEYCTYNLCLRYSSPPFVPTYHSLLSGKP